MKRLLFITLMLIAPLLGCSNTSGSDPDKVETISVEMKNSDFYEYYVKVDLFEGGSRITRQADHFEQSEVVRSRATHTATIYRYKPLEGYIGGDYVEIETSRGSDAVPPSGPIPSKVTLTKISFDIIPGEETIKTIVVSLDNSYGYVFDTGLSGDAEGAVITKQAAHYKTSEIRRGEKKYWEVVYVYIPEEGFVGEDSVEIETSSSSDGGLATMKTERIKFRFLVFDPDSVSYE